MFLIRHDVLLYQTTSGGRIGQIDLATQRQWQNGFRLTPYRGAKRWINSGFIFDLPDVLFVEGDSVLAVASGCLIEFELRSGDVSYFLGREKFFQIEWTPASYQRGEVTFVAGESEVTSSEGEQWAGHRLLDCDKESLFLVAPETGTAWEISPAGALGSAESLPAGFDDGSVQLVREDGRFGAFRYTGDEVVEVGGDVCLQADDEFTIEGIGLSKNGIVVFSREEAKSKHIVELRPFRAPREGLRQCYWAEPVPHWKPTDALPEAARP